MGKTRLLQDLFLRARKEKPAQCTPNFSRSLPTQCNIRSLPIPAKRRVAQFVGLPDRRTQAAFAILQRAGPETVPSNREVNRLPTAERIHYRRAFRNEL